MNKSKFGFLSTHFRYEIVELTPGNDYYATVKDYYKDLDYDNIQNFKYSNRLIEIQTNEILAFGLTDDNNLDYSSFQFYLDQLPTLELNDVAFLFALVKENDKFPLKNAFQFPNNYPSRFAQSFLSETYGQIVFTYQLMQLLCFCLPPKENSHNQINDYRRLYNLRQANFFKKLEGLILPDGFSLSKLLKSYTPYHSDNYGFGFVRKPTHKLAYSFIEKSKKYLLNSPF